MIASSDAGTGKARRVLRRLLVAQCLVIGVPALGAGTIPEELRFEHLANRDGLSQNTVFAILQDRRGFMWFGTKVGLNRYDGYTFKVYNHDPRDPSTLSEGFVRVLHEDPSGIFWIGTYNGGLNRFDPVTETFTTYRHDPEDPTSLSDDDVRAIAQDRSGTLWIGTQGGGLNRFDPAVGTFRRYRPDRLDENSLSHDDVRAIVEDRSGRLWIGTNGGGLNRLDPGAESFVRYQRGGESDLVDNRVRALVEDDAGRLWIGTNGGLCRLDPASDTFAHYRHDAADSSSLSDDQIRSLYVDRSGRLWVGTTGGLNRFDPATETFVRYRSDPDDPFALADDAVYAVFEDRSAGLWFGTYNAGLHRVDPTAPSFTLYRHDPGNPASLVSDEVNALYEERSGDVWIGTYGDGLDRFDPAAGTFTHYRHDPADPTGLADDRVKCIYEDRSGRLWIGMDRHGLSRFDRASETFTHYRHDADDPASLSRDFIRAILGDAEGRVWIGTQGGGLELYDPASGSFVHHRHDPADPFSLSHDSVFALGLDREGTLWVGTYGGGLNRFDPATGVFTAYRYDVDDPASLSDDAVAAIHEDRSGRLWIATYGGGLDLFDRAAGTFAHHSVESGLADDNVVFGILEDRRGRLWFSTNRGVVRLDPRTRRWTSYDTRDGLQGMEFKPGAFHHGPSGRMYVGGAGGFNVFDPEAFDDNTYVPPVVITSFKVFDEDYSGARSSSYLEEVELRYDDNFFSFEFAALNFRRPDKNRYLYQLEGLDEGWIDPGSRRYASYTRVPPGEHVFRVKGSNNDGEWNEAAAEVRIVVAAPWWKTGWFRLSSAALAALLLTGAFRFYTTRRYSRALENEVRLRTRELESSNRLLADSSERLRREVAEHKRTADQLRQARDAAEAANQAKSRFLATMSHEIRTPMNGVIGMTSLLLETRLTEEQREQVETIRKSGDSLLALINDILDYSKIEADRIDLASEPFAVEPCLRDVVDLLAPQADAKGLAVSHRVEPGVPEAILGDASRVRQVLVNLVANAIKFTLRGSVEITARRLEGEEAQRDEIEFSVRDTGIGIPAGRHDQLFRVFSQVDSSSLRHYSGTGLGLAICRQLVDRMGGRIWVESEPGRGSTFSFALPARPCVAPAAPADSQRREAECAGAEMAARMPLRILVAEDNVVNQKIALRILERLGYVADVAGDGREVLDALGREPYDLIFMDVRMPEMDGCEATREVRRGTAWPQPLIVAMTAHAFEEDRVTCLAAGMDGFLSKPISLQSVAAALETLCRSRSEASSVDVVGVSAPADR